MFNKASILALLIYWAPFNGYAEKIISGFWEYVGALGNE